MRWLKKAWPSLLLIDVVLMIIVTLAYCVNRDSEREKSLLGVGFDTVGAAVLEFDVTIPDGSG